MVQLTGQVLFTGTPNNDVVSGTSSGDYLFGDRGNDTLSGLDGTDLLRGYTGNDTLHGGNGSDGLDGGDGNDRLWGDSGNDVLRSGVGSDILNGGDGNDVLSGGLGGDSLIGGVGADIFVFDRASDSSATAPDHIQDFNPSEDHFDLSSVDPFAGANNGRTFSFIGGAAFSADGQIRVATAGSGTIVEVNTSGSNGPEMVIHLDNGAHVTAANFILTGNPNDDVSSDDVVLGDGGDVIHPVHKMADNLVGGAGEDYLNGGAKNDREDGGPDIDIVRGDQDNDILHGGDGHDVLDGYPGNDQLFGDNGNDIARGQQGNDLIYGGAGNDFLDGGTDNDTITGGLGADVLTGGTNSDKFVYSSPLDSQPGARDQITDFHIGEDKLDFSSGGSLHFIGTSAFTAPGQVREGMENGHATVEVNTTGTSGAEMVIDLVGTGLLHPADFVF